jgi:hypothetical protein
MSHIFISYSKKNQPYARKLAAYLLEHGFDIWIDDRIEYGENWWRAIVRAIRTSAACVVVMTPDSEQSTWVEREVALAERQGKHMFPLLLAGENWPLFVLTQYVDVTDGALPGLDFIERLAAVVPRKESYRGRPANLAVQYCPTPLTTQEQQRFLDIMLDAQRPPPERAEAGRQLAGVGDPRPGVGLRADGLPDIDWVEIPSGLFLMGSNREVDPAAYDDELQQHTVILPTFYIGRYPVTYAQFEAFAKEGYQQRELWTAAG